MTEQPAGQRRRPSAGGGRVGDDRQIVVVRRRRLEAPVDGVGEPALDRRATVGHGQRHRPSTGLRQSAAAPVTGVVNDELGVVLDPGHVGRQTAVDRRRLAAVGDDQRQQVAGGRAAAAAVDHGRG